MSRFFLRRELVVVGGSTVPPVGVSEGLNPADRPVSCVARTAVVVRFKSRPAVCSFVFLPRGRERWQASEWLW